VAAARPAGAAGDPEAAAIEPGELEPVHASLFRKIGSWLHGVRYWGFATGLLEADAHDCKNKKNRVAPGG
jgi:hypothetical protein